MASTVIIPLHSNSAEITLSMARRLGPDRIVLCHCWRESGEAHKNAVKLGDYFQKKVIDAAHLEKDAKKRGKIKIGMKVEVKALEYYYSMEGLATKFANFIGEEIGNSKDDQGHLLILDNMPMGYMIGAFYAGLRTNLSVWTGDVGRDIRSKHPAKYQPGDSMGHTLRRISQIKEINAGLNFIQNAPSSAQTLHLSKSIVEAINDKPFTTKDIAKIHPKGYGQNTIGNHLDVLMKHGYAERLEGGSTKYKLTELGFSIAELTTSIDSEEED